MPSLADLLRNDPWGAPPQTPLAKTVTDVGFDPSLGFAGAVQTYLSRLKKMQGGLAQDMLDTAADPNAEGIQRAANLLGGLGLKVANVPMALMPSAQELRDRGYQAGASPELQAVGGALGDMVNIPEPASVGTLLAGLGKAAVGAKGLAGAAAMAGKSAAVAPLGKALEEAGQNGIIAYHGSPHSFDKFDMSKIGTGEGAQAYGHGLYFAENEGVAKSYKNALSGTVEIKPGVNLTAEERKLAGLASALGKGDLPAIKDALSKSVQSGIDPKIAKSVAEKFDSGDIRVPGSMYQVHLDVKPHELLDWDKPLSEQPKHVQEALGSMDVPLYEAWKGNGAWPHVKGSTAYGQLADNLTNAAQSSGKIAQATEKFKAAGIKGIKYKDAGSRGSQGGTYNYVIFDDKLVEILKRYGIPMTAGAGGSMLVAGQQIPHEVSSQLN